MDNIHEKLGIIAAKAEMAHSRIDQLDQRLVNSLRDLQLDVRDLNANMNKQKGWLTALVFLSGLVSGLIQFFIGR